MSQKEEGSEREPSQVPEGIIIRQAVASDAAAIHALLRPYVMQRLLLDRTEAELIELTRHGFVAEAPELLAAESLAEESLAAESLAAESAPGSSLVGFSAVEIYSPKLAELQCLAVHHDYHGSGVGRTLVARCIDRARDLNVMEVMAISSSEEFLKNCGFDYSLPDQKKALFCQLRPRHGQ